MFILLDSMRMLMPRKKMSVKFYLGWPLGKPGLGRSLSRPRWRFERFGRRALAEVSRKS